MGDNETVERCLKEIELNRFKGYPYRIADKSVAQKVICRLKEKNPEAIIIEYRNKQWILPNERVKKTTLAWLGTQIENMERDISEIKKVLDEIGEPQNSGGADTPTGVSNQ